MGMSTSVVGVRDLDGQFAKMAAVKAACEEAGVEYPPAVEAYFKYASENIVYLRREMEEMSIKDAIVKESPEMTCQYTVDLKKLPPEVKAIRFRNSW